MSFHDNRKDLHYFQLLGWLRWGPNGPRSALSFSQGRMPKKTHMIHSSDKTLSALYDHIVQSSRVN